VLDIYYQDPNVTLCCGDCLEVLRRLPSGTIDTCLTSPPYWGLRDYGDTHQLGQESSPDEYAQALARVFTEVRRVLKDSGTIWLNVGDTYYNNGRTKSADPHAYLKNKQLCLVPYRVAMALQDSGWILRNTVVWFKPNAMPSSVSDRLTNRWEPVFLFSKSEDYYFNLDSIRVPPKTSDAHERQRAERMGPAMQVKAANRRELRQWLSSPRHRIHIDGVREIARRPNTPRAWELAAYLTSHLEDSGLSLRDVAAKLGMGYEKTRHYFRTDKVGARLPPDDVWRTLKVLLNLDSRYDDAMRVEYGDNIIRNHPNGKNPGDVVQIAVKPFTGSHFAVMPMDLPVQLLRATMPPGGVCLDPFNGAGTTGVATLSLGGRYIGIDLVRDYLDISIARLRTEPPRTAPSAGQIRLELESACE